jgi:hypothetical protein
MINEYKKLMGMEVGEIISSAYTLNLLKLYSFLYLNGGAPRTCEKSIRKYYYQLKKDFEMNKNIIERTCVPAFEGRRYIPGVFDKEGKLIAGHLHIMGATLTDEEAKKLLDIGALKKSDFIRLPGEKTSAKEYNKEELLELVENGKYKDLAQAARDLGLIKTSANKEKTKEVISNYISEKYG